MTIIGTQLHGLSQIFPSSMATFKFKSQIQMSCQDYYKVISSFWENDVLIEFCHYFIIWKTVLNIKQNKGTVQISKYIQSNHYNYYFQITNLTWWRHIIIISVLSRLLLESDYYQIGTCDNFTGINCLMRPGARVTLESVSVRRVVLHIVTLSQPIRGQYTGHVVTRCYTLSACLSSADCLNCPNETPDWTQPILSPSKHFPHLWLGLEWNKSHPQHWLWIFVLSVMITLWRWPADASLHWYLSEFDTKAREHIQLQTPTHVSSQSKSRNLRFITPCVW